MKTALFLIALSIFCLHNQLFAQKRAQIFVDPVELITDADRALEQSDYSKADSLYALAMSYDLSQENKGRLAINYARTLIELKEFDSALSVYTYGLYADSTNDYIWFLRGELMGKYLRNAEGAAGDISMAIELNPEESMYYESRGLAFDAMKNYPAAERDFTKMIELNDLARNYTSRALFYLRRGELEKALNDANTAIEKDELYTWSYITKGEVFLEMSENTKACDAFLKANEMGNDSPK